MHPALTRLENTFAPSGLTQIADPLLEKCGVELWLKRDDLLHPVISGNKWRKLKYSLDDALKQGCGTLVSMGGAYSNHVHALAFTGQALGLLTIGIVRGERPEVLTPTLADCRGWGMELRFVSRSEYRLLRQYREPFSFPDIEPSQYWLPEGGAQTLALKGIAEAVSEINVPFDVLCVPCGSGATLAGCIAATSDTVQVLGIAALCHADYLTQDVERLLEQFVAASKPQASDVPPVKSTEESRRWQIMPDYAFGGFAKTTPELMAFIDRFESSQQIPLEPVYTGKMLFALFDLAEKGYFAPGARIVALHTGGLQGKRSFIL